MALQWEIIYKLHGGNEWDSKPLGDGTCFCFLPYRTIYKTYLPVRHHVFFPIPWGFIMEFLNPKRIWNFRLTLIPCTHLRIRQEITHQNTEQRLQSEDGTKISDNPHLKKWDASEIPNVSYLHGALEHFEHLSIY